jgi:hypothetical protein
VLLLDTVCAIPRSSEVIQMRTEFEVLTNSSILSPQKYTTVREELTKGDRQYMMIQEYIVCLPSESIPCCTISGHETFCSLILDDLAM